MKLSTLFAGAALALFASAAVAADAPAAKKQTQTIVRTEQDGVSHETRIERDASGKVTITRDG